MKTLLLLAATFSPVADAVLQSLALDVSASGSVTTTITMLASPAFFGSVPSMNRKEVPSLPLTVAPDDNALLCRNETEVAPPDNSYADSILLVPRGTCTFQQKVYNAQKLYKAKAVLIYGALESRYSLNTTSAAASAVGPTEKDIIWPLDKHDYDCHNGQVMVPANQISLRPLPYNAPQNNRLLSGKNNPQNLCRNLQGNNGGASCASQACLLTGNQSSSSTNGGGDAMLQACCAWDVSIFLYNDPQQADQQAAISIPSAYLTLNQAQVLLDLLQENKQQDQQQQSVRIVLYSRWRPWLNCSSLLIWALGVFVAALAAHWTASDYRDFTRRLIRRRAAAAAQAQRSDSTDSQTAQPPRHRPHLPQPEEVLELTAAHAFGFIVMASASLLFLFYFKIYNVVKVFYALGCSGACGQVVVYPLVKKTMKRLGLRDFVVWRTGLEDIGDITARELAAFLIGLVWGLVWLVMAFRVRNPDEVTFFWVTQNIFGACMCIMFLKTIRLTNIHVASILLTVAFFYDIFFVFVTPLLFKGKSVMITVATSGGPPKADALWCEKYPDDVDCQGGDPLPMLLTIPRLFDYQGGSSLLGLGDIVLPGLLISFAARFDAAKSLLGVMGGGSGSLSNHCPEQRFLFGSSGVGRRSSLYFCRLLGCATGGYFCPLVVAYAVGLLMANSAVYLMNMGQPALLYLVPCCLGTMTYIGWRRQELHELWHGPRALRAADAALYGDDAAANNNAAAAAAGGGREASHAPLPMDDNDGLLAEDVLAAVPSAAADAEVDHDGNFAMQEDTNRRHS